MITVITNNHGLGNRNCWLKYDYCMFTACDGASARLIVHEVHVLYKADL